MEIWKDIKGYEGLYFANNSGQIKRKYKGRSLDRILKNQINSEGYYQVCLSKNNVKKSFAVHKIIAELFIKNPENKRCVNHINGIKSDLRLCNLEWSTHSENTQHSFDNKLQVMTPEIRSKISKKLMGVKKIRK